MACNNSCFLGDNSCWLWIILAIIIICCLCGGVGGASYGPGSNTCC